MDRYRTWGVFCDEAESDARYQEDTTRRMEGYCPICGEEMVEDTDLAQGHHDACLTDIPEDPFRPYTRRPAPTHAKTPA